MRVIYYAAASVDGFIARENGSLDWLEKFEGGSEDYGYSELLNKTDALAMGRKTYQQVLEFGDWPYAGKATFVFGKSISDTPAADVYFVRDMDEFMAGIKKYHHETVWLVGGGALAAAFLQAGLIDEMIISYIPVALGTGIPLFESPSKETGFRLTDSRSYDNGMVQITYQAEK